jgi:hypothetical protein
MVTGYTASEYGDFLIAKLQQPYTNTLKIIDWEIAVGLKTPTMTGTVSGVAGSLEVNGIGTQFASAFSSDDKIIIGNIEYVIDQIISANEITITTPIELTFTNAQYYTNPDSINFFEYEYRWSQSGGVFSQFVPLNKNAAYGDLFALTFDTTKPVWLDMKAEVAGITTGTTLSLLSITYTIETIDGIIESCPNFCAECTDPFAMTGCANIEVTCNNSNIFKPYELTKSIGIYKQLTNIVTGIFGHEVNYFRTEPDFRTSDVILMEYSLHNVVDNKTVKILVPDNEFPTEANTYDIFGIELADFEVHITAEEFESNFGAGKTPRNKDYMFIPIMNRMYEISSVSLADEFNMTNSYWRVKLVKYQDRSDVIKGEFDIATDSLVTGIEEIFGEKIKEEYVKTTKPEQFQTVTSLYRDGIREFANKSLKIVDYDLKNRWTVVSKNYYDFTKMQLNDIALFYATPSKVEPGKNAAFTGWFSPQFNVATLNTNDYYLFGDNDAITGFKLTLSSTVFKLSVNGVTESFPHGITLNKNKWYAYIVNINNEFLQLEVSIYSLDPNSNITTTSAGNIVLPQFSSNNLIQEFQENRLMPYNVSWESSSNYTLRANDMYMTNIRMFNTPIELEQHSNVLNQYVVRDNQLAVIIDNAIPSLGFQKFANAR